jgi:hypothetical protein
MKELMKQFLEQDSIPKRIRLSSWLNEQKSIRFYSLDEMKEKNITYRNYYGAYRPFILEEDR